VSPAQELQSLTKPHKAATSKRDDEKTSTCSNQVATLTSVITLQRVLRAYSGKLIARLPKTASGSVNATASAGTSDWQIKMPDDDIPVVCTIVSTAEYCNEIVGSLGRSVAKMLDPPYGEQVCAHASTCTSALLLLLLVMRLIILQDAAQLLSVSSSSTF
jgi:hypothetical protein